MRNTIWVCVGLFALSIAFTGCQRRESYTEADVQRAIAERQREAQVQIERGVRAAPPVEVDTSPQGSANQQRGSTPEVGNVNLLPPPNRYDAPPPASQNMPTQPTPPPSVGDVRLEPRTGEYGIQPPGAPDTYTIPLNQQPQTTPSPTPPTTPQPTPQTTPPTTPQPTPQPQGDE